MHRGQRWRRRHEGEIMLWCEEENFRLKFKKEGKKSCRNLASIKRKPREALDKQREVQNTRYCTQANGHASAERQDRIINRGEIDEERDVCKKSQRPQRHPDGLD